jgi:hypothetical protein
VAVFQWVADTRTDFWLTRDYLPGFNRLLTPGEARHGTGTVMGASDIAECLGGARIEVTPIPWDCRDGFYSAFWRRPEAYLDPVVRDGISVFSRLDADEAARGLVQLERDLASGEWTRRNRDILEMDQLDLGYRLFVAAEGASG